MPRFAATTHAFEKGVENISPEAAIKLIEDWESQLEGVDSKEGKSVTRDLAALKKELGKGEKMDGDKVKQLTAKLGQETVAAAEKMEGSEADKVRGLGETLTNVAA